MSERAFRGLLRLAGLGTLAALVAFPADWRAIAEDLPAEPAALDLRHSIAPDAICGEEDRVQFLRWALPLLDNARAQTRSWETYLRQLGAVTLSGGEQAAAAELDRRRARAEQTVKVARAFVASAQSEIDKVKSAAIAECIDPCLEGTWEAVVANPLDSKYITGGGTAFRVVFHRDGTEVIDYDAMHPFEFNQPTESLTYSGTAAARIQTKERKATIQGIQRADVSMRMTSAPMATPWVAKLPGLGPGGLGGTTGDNAYECDSSWLQYTGTLHKDGHPNLQIKLKRLEAPQGFAPTAAGVTGGAGAAGGGATETAGGGTVGGGGTPGATATTDGGSGAGQAGAAGGSGGAAAEGGVPTTMEGGAQGQGGAGGPTSGAANDGGAPGTTSGGSTSGVPGTIAAAESGGNGDTTGSAPAGSSESTVSGPAPPAADCPQRGKGCVALILDYSKAMKLEIDFQDVAENLRKMCVVDYVTPAFKADPQPGTDAKEADEVARYNAAQQRMIDNAIARHRNRVSRFGAELVIEMIIGHGNHAGWCGEVGAETGPGIKRGAFNSGNYAAVKRNACAWFVADFTCESGLTPKGFDDLNNAGLAACRAPFASNCANHAAYESDIAVGTATARGGCKFFPYANPKRSINNVIEAEQENMQYPYKYAGLIKELSQIYPNFVSYYSDRGYKHCDPVSRKGY
jgi:hypothetical protein